MAPAIFSNTQANPLTPLVKIPIAGINTPLNLVAINDTEFVSLASAALPSLNAPLIFFIRSSVASRSARS